MRILSIIGLVLTLAFLVWVCVAAFSNGTIDMEEFAPLGFLYGLFMLPLTVVGIVSGGRRHKR